MQGSSGLVELSSNITHVIVDDQSASLETRAPSNHTVVSNSSSGTDVVGIDATSIFANSATLYLDGNGDKSVSNSLSNAGQGVTPRVIFQQGNTGSTSIATTQQVDDLKLTFDGSSIGDVTLDASHIGDLGMSTGITVEDYAYSTFDQYGTFISSYLNRAQNVSLIINNLGSAKLNASAMEDFSGNITINGAGGPGVVANGFYVGQEIIVGAGTNHIYFDSQYLNNSVVIKQQSSVHSYTLGDTYLHVTGNTAVDLQDSVTFVPVGGNQSAAYANSIAHINNIIFSQTTADVKFDAITSNYDMSTARQFTYDASSLTTGVLTIDLTDMAQGSAVTAAYANVIGGDANDSIIGGSGNDIIRGGAGLDTMYGGIGADTFVFAGEDLMGPNPNNMMTPYADIIGDFVSGVDKIHLALNGASFIYHELMPGGPPKIVTAAGAVTNAFGYDLADLSGLANALDMQGSNPQFINLFTGNAGTAYVLCGQMVNGSVSFATALDVYAINWTRVNAGPPGGMIDFDNTSYNGGPNGFQHVYTIQAYQNYNQNTTPASIAYSDIVLI